MMEPARQPNERAQRFVALGLSGALASWIVLGLLASLALSILIVSWIVGRWTGVILALILMPIASFGILEVVLLALTVLADFGDEATGERCRRTSQVVAHYVVMNTVLLLVVFVSFAIGVIWTS